MTEKLDLKKQPGLFYQPSAKQPQIVDLPTMNFLMIDGAGNPNTSPLYQQAVEALYSVSYTLKFTCKKELGKDYGVMPLEGLWWGTRIDQHVFSEADKDQFQWTMMIMQPDFITPAMVERGAREAAAKKDLPLAANLRFEPFTEGTVVQIMHIGPFDTEGPTVETMHNFAFEQGYHLRGKHHEIYLSDPRRTDPAKWKTIVRHPIEK